MSASTAPTIRHFVTYSGVKLPLRLVNELQPSDTAHRNTFFRGVFDDQDRPLRIEKVVYGEIELCHVYRYDDRGTLRQAQITDADGEVTDLAFDENGLAI